jgi:hypothetical protein
VAVLHYCEAAATTAAEGEGIRASEKAEREDYSQRHAETLVFVRKWLVCAGVRAVTFDRPKYCTDRTCRLCFSLPTCSLDFSAGAV